MKDSKIKEFFKAFCGLLREEYYEEYASLVGSDEIEKSEDTEERISIEVVYEPDVKDSHGEWMTAETIRKGCESFNKNLEEGVVKPNLFHYQNTDTFEIQKSWINEELDVVVKESGEEVKAGAWLVKVHYKDPAIWNLKKSGDILGVSMFGYGNRDESTGEITNLTFDEVNT